MDRKGELLNAYCLTVHFLIRVSKLNHSPQSDRQASKISNRLYQYKYKLYETKKKRRKGCGEIETKR